MKSLAVAGRSSDPPGIRPGPGLGDPPQVVEGGEIPIEIEGSPGTITVGVVGDPVPPRTYTPEEVAANGGKVPLPAGATGGLVAYVTTSEPPYSSFLVEVIAPD